MAKNLLQRSNEEAMRSLDIRFNCHVVNEMGRIQSPRWCLRDAGERVSFVKSISIMLRGKSCENSGLMRMYAAATTHEGYEPGIIVRFDARHVQQRTHFEVVYDFF